MGFSQGAALACTLLAEGKKAGRNEFKCAVFICAGLPFRADGMGQLAVEEMGGLVDVPTAHIVGRQDELYEDGMKLYKLCEGGKAVVYDHGSGHCVPFDPETTDRMVKVIEEVIGRV